MIQDVFAADAAVQPSRADKKAPRPPMPRVASAVAPSDTPSSTGGVPVAAEPLMPQDRGDANAVPAVISATATRTIRPVYFSGNKQHVPAGCQKKRAGSTTQH
jgi:hypothetical protein